MKTTIQQYGSLTKVSLQGKLDFDFFLQLKNNLHKIEKEQPQEVIFDFIDLEFVGSSGITAFIDILKEFNLKIKKRPRYLNVKSEFKKLIQAFDQDKVFEFEEIPLEH